MIIKILKNALMSVVLLLFMLLSACVSMNDDRDLQELVNHMAVHVGGIYSGRVFVPPVKAAKGIAMKIEGRDVFFYQYDLKRKKQRKKLDQIHQMKKVYINGIPFAAEVNGSFVMIGHDTNNKKKELITAFKKF